MSTETEPIDARLTRRLVMMSVATLVLAFIATFLWVWLAEPAQWEVRDAGIVLTEAASKGQFSVIVTFVLIGIGTSVLLGGAAGWVLSDLGWLVTPVVIVLTVLASLIVWRLGIALGPPTPASVSGVSIGDRIPAQLEIDALAPFLAWPIFGLAGVIVATWVKERR